MSDPYDTLRDRLEAIQALSKGLSRRLGDVGHRCRTDAASIAAFAVLALEEVGKLSGTVPPKRPSGRKAPRKKAPGRYADSRPLASDILDRVRAIVAGAGKAEACRRLGVTSKTLNRLMAGEAAQGAVHERISAALGGAIHSEPTRSLDDDGYESLLGDLEEAAGLTAGLRG